MSVDLAEQGFIAGQLGKLLAKSRSHQVIEGFPIALDAPETEEG
jgi:hypothetical protein